MQEYRQEKYGVESDSEKKEKHIRKLKESFAGLGVILFIASIFGLFQEGLLGALIGIVYALQFILASIICTAGISLVIWIPLIRIIGQLFFKLLSLFKKAGNNSGEFTMQINNNQKAIIDYILQARGVGLDDDSIKQKLMTEGGWSKEEVENAFKITPLL